MNRRSTPFAVLGLISIFVVGAATGIVLDRTLHRPRAASVGTAELHEHLLSQLRDRLALDDAQFEEIDSLLRRHQSTVNHAWQALEPQVRAAIDSVHHEIETLLRPGQRDAFRKWVAEQSPGAETHLRHP